MMGMAIRIDRAFMVCIWLQSIQPWIFSAGSHWLYPHEYIWLLANQNKEKGTKIELVMSIILNSSISLSFGMPATPLSFSKHRIGFPSEGLPPSRHRIEPQRSLKKSPR